MLLAFVSFVAFVVRLEMRVFINRKSIIEIENAVEKLQEDNKKKEELYNRLDKLLGIFEEKIKNQENSFEKFTEHIDEKFKELKTQISKVAKRG